MYARTYAAWTTLAMDSLRLGLDASMVMGLRVSKLAAGGTAAGDEAQLMVTEKLQSALELQTAMMTGGLGATPLAASQSVIRHYRKKVAANRRRLG